MSIFIAHARFLFEDVILLALCLNHGSDFDWCLFLGDGYLYTFSNLFNHLKGFIYQGIIFVSLKKQADLCLRKQMVKYI